MNDMNEEDIIERLEKRISYLESVLSEIQMLNAMGKTLKISEAIQAAINE
jgi:16S rRNA G527 N7-methylase RsmG